LLSLVACKAEPKIGVHISWHIKPILEEFYEILSKDLPNELPPMRDIQHDIDSVPRVTLLNLLHYRMNHAEHAELQRQVESYMTRSSSKKV